jgi:hypothetical protein
VRESESGKSRENENSSVDRKTNEMTKSTEYFKESELSKQCEMVNSSVDFRGDDSTNEFDPEKR